MTVGAVPARSGKTGSVDSPLTRPVEAFVARFAPVLVALAAESRLGTPDKLPGDVALEALNLASAFVDADGRHTDEELRAVLAVFGRLFDTVARAGTPAGLRVAGLLAGNRTFLDRPSALFVLRRARRARRQGRAVKALCGTLFHSHADPSRHQVCVVCRDLAAAAR